LGELLHEGFDLSALDLCVIQVVVEKVLLEMLKVGEIRFYGVLRHIPYELHVVFEPVYGFIEIHFPYPQNRR